MSTLKQRLGLMGGTFDPIHFGHLFIAEEARIRFELDRVLFIPAHQPAHAYGKTAHAEAETRFELTRLAVERNPAFSVSRVELDRPGPSYAIDTVQHLREEHDNTELFFIVGGDSINELPTWHRAAELLQMCRFIAFTREGHPFEQARQKFAPDQLERIEWLKTIVIPISSTLLRQRVQNKLPIRYLTPDAVAEEIARRELYKKYDNY